MSRILIGASGGVDSSVCVLMLKKENTVGLAHLWVTDGPASAENATAERMEDKFSAAEEKAELESPDGNSITAKGNTVTAEAGPASAAAVRRLAAQQGCDCFIIDKRAEFASTVEAYFVRSYAECITPNPCIYCNRNAKLPWLIEAADRLGFDKVATGHYARVDYNAATGRWEIRKAADRTKDQSYMLCRLTQEQLSRLVMPLGVFTKGEIREMAAQAGLESAHSKDSQDVCFIPDGDYAKFVRSRLEGSAPCNTEEEPASVCGQAADATETSGMAKPPAGITEYKDSNICRAQTDLSAGASCLEPGDFVDTDGRMLGRHKGLLHYTIGQRKGLGLALPAPLYVKDKDPGTNRVILCPNDGLFASEVRARDINFVSISGMDGEMRVTAKIRYSQGETAGTAFMSGEDEVTVRFDSPVRAPARGQSLVMYDGDRLLGGGIII